jgi:long-chain-fatty-acid--CoA ligase ACSBG
MGVLTHHLFSVASLLAVAILAVRQAHQDTEDRDVLTPHAEGACEKRKVLTPMEGGFTACKYEYDPLTRYTVNEGENPIKILDLLERAAKLNGDKIALRQPWMDEEGNLVKKKWHETGHHYKYTKRTWSEFHNDVKTAAAAFVAMGLEPMDAVNIRGVNSPEWLIAFLGAIAAGGLPVGLYPTDSEEAVKFKAVDSGASFIVVGKARDLGLYSKFLNDDEFSGVKAVIMWDINKDHPEHIESAIVTALNTSHRPLLKWEQFMAKGGPDLASAGFQGAYDEGFDRYHELKKRYDEVKKRYEAIVPGQAASVVYTSGTTGNPKGVMLTHDSITWAAGQIAKALLTTKPKDGQMRIMSYLPLNHVAGQMLDIISPIFLTAQHEGEYTTVFFPAMCYLKKRCSIETLSDTNPTLFLGVPLVWEGLKQKLETKTSGGLAGTLAGFDFGKGLIKGKVGLNNVMYAISGAGAITKPTLNFFHEWGLDILNMYAQSESSALGTSWSNEDYANFNFTQKAGSIGRAVGNELKIENPDADGRGEILLKGRNVMLGYLNRPDKTAETITEDGWLKTGDLGQIDKDGFVFLTGRLKEIMKDRGGEMIAPNAVEEGITKFCNKPGKTIIKQAIVVGDGEKYLSVLLTLTEYVADGVPSGKLVGAAKEVDESATTVEAARASAKWQEELSGCIAEYNTDKKEGAAKRPEQVWRFFILPREITAENDPDLMTPTFKIKRTGVNDGFAEEISTCFGEEDINKGEGVKPCGA